VIDAGDRYYANIVTESTQWEPPVDIPVCDEFGEFEDGGDVAGHQQQHSAEDNADHDLAAAIALSLQEHGSAEDEFGDFEGSVVGEREKHQLDNHQGRHQNRTAPPVDLFSFENLDSPKAPADSSVTTEEAEAVAVDDSAAGNSNMAVQSSATDMLNFDEIVENESSGAPMPPQTQHLRLDPLQMLSQFRSSELMDLVWDPTDAAASSANAAADVLVSVCETDLTSAHADGAEGSGAASDGDSSSASEWGEFASFEDATPSKRGEIFHLFKSLFTKSTLVFSSIVLTFMNCFAGLNILGFFSEYEVQSQVTSLVSVLKTATAIVSNTNSGVYATCAVVHAVQVSSVVVFV
jgi:hypothetical protein